MIHMYAGMVALVAVAHWSYRDERDLADSESPPNSFSGPIDGVLRSRKHKRFYSRDADERLRVLKNTLEAIASWPITVRIVLVTNAEVSQVSSLVSEQVIRRRPRCSPGYGHDWCLPWETLGILRSGAFGSDASLRGNENNQHNLQYDAYVYLEDDVKLPAATFDFWWRHATDLYQQGYFLVPYCEEMHRGEKVLSDCCEPNACLQTTTLLQETREMDGVYNQPEDSFYLKFKWHTPRGWLMNRKQFSDYLKSNTWDWTAAQVDDKWRWWGMREGAYMAPLWGHGLGGGALGIPLTHMRMHAVHQARSEFQKLGNSSVLGVDNFQNSLRQCADSTCIFQIVPLRRERSTKADSPRGLLAAELNSSGNASDWQQLGWLGLGTDQLSGSTARDTVKQALKSGYQMIDTAWEYSNMKNIRDGVEASGVDRASIFLQSKVTFRHNSYAEVFHSAQQIAQQAPGGYVDRLLLHFPHFIRDKPEDETEDGNMITVWEKYGFRVSEDPEVGHTYRREAWRALEDAKTAGLTRSIGVSNFMEQHLEELRGYARPGFWPPASNQVELHPFLPRDSLVNYCQGLGIAVQAFGSISPDGTRELLDDPVVKEIALAHQHTSGQVLLRWALQRGVTVLPRTVRTERLVENFGSLEFNLSPLEMDRMKGLACDDQHPTGCVAHFPTGCGKACPRGAYYWDPHAVPVHHLGQVGLGTDQMWGSTARDSVLQALQLGYRIIDTAWEYSNMESIRDAVLASGVDRSSIFLQSKVTFRHTTYALVLHSAEQLARQAPGGYVDRLLLHFPHVINDAAGQDGEDAIVVWEKYGMQISGDHEIGRAHRVEAWRALEDAQKRGFTRSIGVSNFEVKHLEELRTYARPEHWPPASNQVELHPFLQRSNLVRYCQRLGISVQAYGSIYPDGTQELLEHPAVQEVAVAHQSSSAQVLLRWAVQRGLTVFPRTTRAERLEENSAAARLALTSADMRLLRELACDVTFPINCTAHFPTGCGATCPRGVYYWHPELVPVASSQTASEAQADSSSEAPPERVDGGLVMSPLLGHEVTPLFRLPWKFNLSKLQEEIASEMLDWDWSKSAHGHGMALAPLRLLHPEFRTHFINKPVKKGALERCPELRRVFNFFRKNTDVVTFRLLRRVSLSAYGLHNDADLSMRPDVRRLNMPIFSNVNESRLLVSGFRDQGQIYDGFGNEGALMHNPLLSQAEYPYDWKNEAEEKRYYNSEPWPEAGAPRDGVREALRTWTRDFSQRFGSVYPMPSGFFHHFDTNWKHTLVNWAETERVVLICDILDNDWLHTEAPVLDTKTVNLTQEPHVAQTGTEGCWNIRQVPPRRIPCWQPQAECWGSFRTWSNCCDPEKWGYEGRGNPRCWDPAANYTFKRCCKQLPRFRRRRSQPSPFPEVTTTLQTQPAAQLGMEGHSARHEAARSARFRCYASPRRPLQLLASAISDWLDGTASNATVQRLARDLLKRDPSMQLERERAQWSEARCELGDLVLGVIPWLTSKDRDKSKPSHNLQAALKDTDTLYAALFSPWRIFGLWERVLTDWMPTGVSAHDAKAAERLSAVTARLQAVLTSPTGCMDLQTSIQEVAASIQTADASLLRHEYFQSLLVALDLFQKHVALDQKAWHGKRTLCQVSSTLQRLRYATVQYSPIGTSLRMLDGSSGTFSAWAFRRVGILESLFVKSSFLSSDLMDELMVLTPPINHLHVLKLDGAQKQLPCENDSMMWILIAHVQSQGLALVRQEVSEILLDLNSWQIFLIRCSKASGPVQFEGRGQQFLAFATPHHAEWIRHTFPQIQLMPSNYHALGLRRVPVPQQVCFDRSSFISDLASRNWANSHGITSESAGAALMYYALARRTRGPHVVLGSGGGVVPSVVGQAVLSARSSLSSSEEGPPDLLLVDFMGGTGHCELYNCPEQERGRASLYGAGVEMETWAKGLEKLNIAHWVLESTSAAARWAGQFKQGIGFLFVDADHSLEGAVADLASWLPLVSEGGLVIMHDTAGLYSVQLVPDLLGSLGLQYLQFTIGEGFIVFQKTLSSDAPPASEIPSLGSDALLELRLSSSLLRAQSGQHMLAPAAASEEPGRDPIVFNCSSMQTLDKPSWLIYAAVHSVRPGLAIVAAPSDSRLAQLVAQAQMDSVGRGDHAWTLVASSADMQERAVTSCRPDVVAIEVGTDLDSARSTAWLWVQHLAVTGIIIIDCGVTRPNVEVGFHYCTALLQRLKYLRVLEERHAVDFVHFKAEGILMGTTQKLGSST